MRVVLFFLTVCLATSCPAQTDCGWGGFVDVLRCQHEFQKVSFYKDAGTITLVVPREFKAGEHLSSRVFLHPDGADEAEKAKNERALRQFRISRFNQTAALKSDVLFWVADRNKTLDLVCALDVGEDLYRDHISWRERCREIWAADRLPLQKDETYIPELQVRSMPLRIYGLFNGNLTNTYVTIDGAKVEPLAASEQEILIESPPNPGLHELAVRDIHDKETKQQVRFINVDTTPPSFSLRTGSTNVTVTLSGLGELDRPLIFSLEPLRYQKLNLRIGKFTSTNLRRYDSPWRVWPRARHGSASLLIDKSFVNAKGEYSLTFMLSVNESTGKQFAPMGVLNGRDAYAGIDYQLNYMSAGPATSVVVRNAVLEWTEDNSIGVEDAARAAIVDGIGSRGGDLMEAYSGYQEQFMTYFSFLRVFTRTYLYELALRHRTPTPPRLNLNAFWSSQIRGVDQIGISDIKSMALNRFYALWAELMRSKAWVEIQSAPTGMIVSINRESNSSDPPTNGRLDLPAINKEVVVYVSGSGAVCKTALQFACSGYHGVLKCIAQDGHFDEQLTPSCMPSRDRNSMESTP